MSDFLLEIGTEEIPARMIASATEELQRRIGELVGRERLSSSANIEAPASEAFASPRRIAVLVHGLAASQPDVPSNFSAQPPPTLTRTANPPRPPLPSPKK